MASSVQFKGIEGVVDAYESRAVAPWSLWQGRQFMFKYEGNDITEGAQQLQATLQLLAESTNAIYTLKVYEDLKGGKIKSNTPDDGSFNFKINGEDQALTQSQYTAHRNSNEILQRLQSIEERLNAEEEEEEEAPRSRLGVIGDILSDPAIQPIVQPLIAKIFGTATPQRTIAAINGINDDAILSNAIAELKKHDANLPAHLAKLAQIAKESPDSFKFLINTLDQM